MQFSETVRNNFIKYTLTVLMASSLCIAQNHWVTKTSMPTARFALSASVADGIIYAVGGNAGLGTGTSVLEAYDPESDIWETTLPPMPTPREVLASASVDGKIYAIGGRTSPGSGVLGTVEMYDPSNSSWSTKSSMAVPRVILGAVAVNGKIYAIGGANFSAGQVFSTVEVYDPQTDTWTPKADMPTPRHSFEIAAVNGKIYACGGDTNAGSGGETVAVEAYDPVTDTWESKADLPAPRSAYAAAAGELNGKLYIVSGSEAAFPHSPLTASVLEYAPDTDTWREREQLIPTARASFAAVIVDNLLYALGGSATSFPFTPTNAVEAYAYMTGIGDNSHENIVEKFTLHENFPNPFNTTTTIAFDLPTNGFVHLKIFDIAGREVAELASGQLAAGAHQVQWNAGGFASGVYFYQLQVSQNQREQFTQTKKMMLIK